MSEDEDNMKRAGHLGLRARLGYDEAGEPVVVDLKDRTAGGMGSHGLCVGAVGSGKSELLRAVVFDLAMTYPPDTVNFLLVDLYSTATFQGFEGLPHTAGVAFRVADDISNVDSLVRVLDDELRRRQLSAANGDLADTPALVILIDDIAEMLTYLGPADVITRIAGIGGQLGVHLLGASRAMPSKVAAFMSYRIALPLFSTAQSREVLGVPDAVELPRIPGCGYLKHGDDAPLRRFTVSMVTDDQVEDLRRRWGGTTVE